MASQLYMIPCPIAEINDSSIPEYVKSIIYNIEHFIVERSKTARAFLKKIEHPKPQNELRVEEMDKHDPFYAQKILKEWMSDGKIIGVLSEAGCPGIADPGAKLVDIAHRNNVRVIPLIGPSSIFLALMASGMNGQQFSFHGYLPNKKDQLKKKLQSIEKHSKAQQSAEIFIETPYRNQSIFSEIISACAGDTYLCIAADITGKDEYIHKKKIKDWARGGFPLQNKVPAIYIIGK